jgi:hypothetical protein
MTRNFIRRITFSAAALIFLAGAQAVSAQIPGQLAEDFVAGRVPGEEEIAKLEKEVAARPQDLRLVRKLGKGYFFQFFGEGRAAARPKAQKTLERALEIRKDDPETIAYLGGLRPSFMCARKTRPSVKPAGGGRSSS